VNATTGMLNGYWNDAGVRVWKGIRYAKAPVNELRWSPPESPEYLLSVFQANVESPGCPQSCEAPHGM